jgi:hypothetical protein
MLNWSNGSEWMRRKRKKKLERWMRRGFMYLKVERESTSQLNLVRASRCRCPLTITGKTSLFSCRLAGQLLVLVSDPRLSGV